MIQTIILTVIAMALPIVANAGLYEKYKDMSTDEAKKACPDEQFKKAPASFDGGLRMVDFTGLPEGCAARFAKSISNKYMVIVAERKEKVWRDAAVNAAIEIQVQTRKSVIVAYCKDVNPDDELAITSFWAWGHKRDSYGLQDTYGIHSDLLEAKNSKDKMVARGVGVQEYKNKADKNLIPSSKKSISQ